MKNRIMFRRIAAFVGYLVAMTIMGMCISLPFGLSGFFAGFIAWPIVLTLILFTLKPHEREAVFNWLTTTNCG